MRKFKTGATRDDDEEKIDYEGFLSPQVEQRFAEYMHVHRKQADGQLRASDNWQKGMPKDAYMKSMFRHFMDVWKAHRGLPGPDLEESLCALKFNVNGMLHEVLNDPIRIISGARDLCAGPADVPRPAQDQQITERILDRKTGLLRKETAESAQAETDINGQPWAV